MGRFIFRQHYAVYVYNHYGGASDIYQRYFLDFLITKKLTTGISLKSHGLVADFLDYRFGFSW